LALSGETSINSFSAEQINHPQAQENGPITFPHNHPKYKNNSQFNEAHNSIHKTYSTYANYDPRSA
jgi:hypothetical protein